MCFKGASQHWKANFERSLTQRRRLYTEGEDLDVAWTYNGGWAAVEASNDLDETPNTEALLGGLQHGSTTRIWSARRPARTTRGRSGTCSEWSRRVLRSERE